MAYTTNQSPERCTLRACPRCMAPPQVFRAADKSGDLWVFSCPDCGLCIIGRRVEGLGLGGRDIIDVTKPGDTFDEMVEIWNNLPAVVAEKGVQG